jgi:predicted esterase YcpF (UPF0227 family)
LIICDYKSNIIRIQQEINFHDFADAQSVYNQKLRIFVGENKKSMETQYGKEFPDIMEGKKIMYVHGFMSSAQSNTVKVLQRLLPSAKVFAEDLPIHPEEAMALLRKLCEEEKPDLIIGTSMGGMYTEMLRGFDRILVNPAFQMGQTMKDSGMTGKQQFQNPRKDGVQEFLVTKALEKEYVEITTQCFNDIDEDDKKRVYGLFGDNDPVVHTFDMFREHYPNAIHFHGEHRLSDPVALHYVIPIVRWIDDKQEKRERPIIYIEYESLIDIYGNARSSMHKAYEMLLDNYLIYIVAPSPTNDHALIDEMQKKVEDLLSAPAHDRVIFTNQPQLLYGDYYIGTNPPEDAMTTTITLGSDEFKTWEDIITYFSRLGGQ